MSTLDDDLDGERRRVAVVRKRAERRLAECELESAALLERGKAAAASGDPDRAASLERRVQKLRQRSRRYTSLVDELSGGRERLIREVLLARLQGPGSDVLLGEAERNREELIRVAENLLGLRERQRSLRQRWVEINDKIRTLRQKTGLAPQRTTTVDFRIHVTPSTYQQKDGGPTFREVADLLKHLGL